MSRLRAWRRPLPFEELAPLDAAIHSVWLHGNWRFLTQQMTTEQREAAANAVVRYGAVLEPDFTVDPDRWWREEGYGETVRNGESTREPAGWEPDAPSGCVVS